MIDNTVFTISGNMIENTVFTISGNMVAGCSNQLQVAQGQVLVKNCSLVQAAVGCFILLLLVTKMVLTLCNLCWSVVFFCHQLAQRPHMHMQWASLATCNGGVFLVPATAFTNVHTCTSTFCNLH